MSVLLLCRVEANKFADWTQEEFEALMLPNRHSRAQHPTFQSMQQSGASVRLHTPALNKTMLPSTVDWRGTPADSPVKDQAACGSCWVSQLLTFSGGICLDASRGEQQPRRDAAAPLRDSMVD